MSRQKAAGLLLRYPETTIVWAASDFISLGAIDAIEQLGKSPGIDILTGGIDWTDRGLQSVYEKRMTVTVGGHFMEGAWALILLHDYHHGIDFSDSHGVWLKTKMEALTSDNVHPYLQQFGTHNWNQIDFKQFSKFHNPQLTHYRFGLSHILNGQGES